jgi:hypothetical protein
MLQFINSQFIFYISIILVLFLPGYLFLRAVNAGKKIFSRIEVLVFSVPFSIILVDLLMIVFSKLKIPYSRISLVIGIILLILVFLGIEKILKKKEQSKDEPKQERGLIFDFTKRQTMIILIILFLSFFVRVVYLSDSVIPTSTDLGHHMYWAKNISMSGNIPAYEESEIIQNNQNYSLSEPKGIADFIIGEHLIFAAVNLISGMDYISSFPLVILLILNMMAIAVYFLLTLRFFSDNSHRNQIAIIMLLIIGPLFALSSPQAKFVSGGVVGNILGNLFIPAALYFLFRAFKEKSFNLLSLFILILAGLAYSHHLSLLIIIFVILFAALIYLIFNRKKIWSVLLTWIRLIFGKKVILMTVLMILFFVFFYTPTYLNFNAINTAVGSPEKSTRLGLIFGQLAGMNSEIKLALAIIGLFLIFIINWRKLRYNQAILSGWTIALLIMTLKPNWLFIDIPSNRIAAYAYFPLAILAAYALVDIFSKLELKNGKIPKVLFLILFLFLIYFGLFDNSLSVRTESKSKEAMATFLASDYLAKRTISEDGVIKDHNYLIADSWIKLFFMRGYNYPLSRGYFKRYEDEFNQREKCTLWMISAPDSAEAKKCITGTGINYFMVNGMFDSAQFVRSDNFSKIYDSGNVTIFSKK